MGTDRIPHNRPGKYRLAAIGTLLAAAVCSGCALRRSASFLPVDQVECIRVSRNVGGRQVSDVCVVDDPARIAQVYEFLKRHEKGWEPMWDTPRGGDYSILLETGGQWQSIFIVADMMQTNSGGAPVKRKLSAESQQELLALLGLQPQTVSENNAPVRPASHRQGG